MTAGGTTRVGASTSGGKQEGYGGGPTTTTTTTATFFSSSPTLPSMHLDFVTDVAFDHYGRRIATCSGDRTVRVWDLDDEGTWTTAGDNDGGGGGGTGANMSEWQAHRGAVTRLSWAHPEFGQLLATCGTDHAATVWEEREGSFLVPGGGGGGGGNASAAASSTTQQQQQQGGGGGAATRWVAKAQLTDARKAVSCVSFAPRHLGLRIATGSADGLVRIYEAIDVMNLNHWPMQGSIDTSDESSSSGGGGGGGSNSASSSGDPRDATRSGGTGQQRPYSSRGTGGGLGSHGQYQQQPSSSSAASAPSSSSSPDELGVTGLSWCPGRFEPPTLAVGTSGGSVRVYRYSDASRTWQSVLTLPGHEGGVLDVSWAPNVGRSYHLIATAGKDDALRLHRLKRLRGVGGEGGSGGAAAATSTALELESSQVLTDPAGDGGMAAPSEVWRVAWNVTGTVLASSGDGGIVRMWKGNFRNEWSVVSEVHGRPSSAVVVGSGSSEEEEGKEMMTQ